MSKGDINDAIMPCERCNDLIAIGKGHISRIEPVGPGIKGVWYKHIDVKDCTPYEEAVQSHIGKPYIEVKVPEIALEESAKKTLLRLKNDLAYMVKGFNLDGMHGIANEAQTLLMSVEHFRNELVDEDLAEYSWTDLKGWSPPEENDEEM